MQPTVRDDNDNAVKRSAWNRTALLLGPLGILSFAAALWVIRSVQFKVVSYTTTSFSPSDVYLPPIAFVVLLCVGLLALAFLTARRDSDADNGALSDAQAGRSPSALSMLTPLVLSAPLACFVFADRIPTFSLGYFLIAAGGWAAYRAGSHWRISVSSKHGHKFALVSLVALIALLTVVHTRIQINFFEHFMLGHADIGHFAEELKNALRGRGLRCDSFDNTRFGWHFVPLMYALAPAYAMWSSPVLLMVCSALLGHIVALPAYFLARRVTGSTAVAWMCAVAWLLLPSQSRLVYGNTYGFQWSNVCMLLIALVITAGVAKRWVLCCAMVGLLLLSRETAAAAALGWGVYLALFTDRRRTGIAIGVVAVVYVAICLSVVIPHFAAAGRYERLDLFGSLGGSMTELASSVVTQPGAIMQRLFRGQSIYLLMTLLVPMAFLPIRGWRLALAAVPTLIPVLLLQNGAWVSIKFWHHASLLPFLFFGGILSMHSHDAPERRPSRFMCWLAGSKGLTGVQLNYGLASALLVSASFGHYLFGFSPISKPYEPVVDSAFLQTPDPRFEVITRLRAAIPKAKTILATERVAAYFTDYDRLYTGRAMREADFVIIDQSDRWDTSQLPSAGEQFRSNPQYRLLRRDGPILVFERIPTSSTESDD